jgi:hypothetical protein
MAAIGGAAGGALGGLLGWCIQKVAGKRDGWPARIASACGIILGIGGARIAVALMQPSAEAQIDNSVPLYATLHRYYPEEYQQIAAKISAVQGGTSDKVALENEIRPVLSNIILNRRAQISDQNTVDMIGVLVQEAMILKNKDAQSCVSLMNAGTTRVDLGDALPPSVMQRDLSVSNAVLVQLATAPAPAPVPLDRSELQSISLAALATLPSDERSAIVTLLGKNIQPRDDLEARAMCDFTIGLMNKAMSAKAGTLRSLVSAG